MFLLVPAILLVHFVSLRRIKRKAMMFANYEAMEKVFGRKILSRNYPLLLVRVVTLVLLILSLTGMVIVYEGHVSDSDYVLAIDASASMLAQDYQPDRLSAAKSAALLFLDSVPEGAKVGVMSFAGTGFVKQELTDDIGKAREAVSAIGAEISGGTAIGEAMVSSSDMLLPSTKDKSIILLTDGENNIGISIDDALAYVKRFRVTVNTIGVGSEEGGIVANTSFRIGLDSETLQKIANETGGRYFRAKTKRDIETAYITIATGSEKSIDLDLSPFLLLAALASFMVEMILVNTKYRTIP